MAITQESFGLVIPCYNFGAQATTLCQRLEAWRQATAPHVQVCLVNDGSTDQTAAILQNFGAQHPDWVKVIHLTKNRGKGFAIRLGWENLAAYVPKVVFTDCDLHYGLEIIGDRVLPLLDSADVVMADRSWSSQFHKASGLRRLASTIFNRWVAVLTGVFYRDTQAGLKGFRVDSFSEIFDLLKVDGFAFDVEMLSLALHYRFRIVQLPVRFDHSYQEPAGSTVFLLKTFWRMMKETLEIGWRWHRKEYQTPQLSEKVEKSTYLIK